jgi:hypothetical protein
MTDLNLTDDELKNLLAFDEYLNAESLRVAEEQRIQQAEADARNAEFERQVSKFWQRMREAAQAPLPEALRPFVVASPVDEEYDPMPAIGWVLIEAPCCAPVHLYMQMMDGQISPAQFPLWLPKVRTPNCPDEDGGTTVRYVFTSYADYHPHYPMSDLGTVMVEARRLYNEYVSAQIEWSRMANVAQAEPQEVRTIIPTPEERLRFALEDMVTDILDNALERRGL